jgi:hypothetical protein
MKTELPSSKEFDGKSWSESDFECPECGNIGYVFTNASYPYYWDGDELECPECKLQGGVQADEDGSYALWDW